MQYPLKFFPRLPAGVPRQVLPDEFAAALAPFLAAAEGHGGSGKSADALS